MNDNATAAAETEAPIAISDGQAMLDRMLAQCNRYNHLRQRLDCALLAIAPSLPRPPATEPGAPPAPATSFFEALTMLADGNDQVADELEHGIAALEKLF